MEAHDILARIDQGFAALNARFDAVDKRLDGIEDVVTTIGKAIRITSAQHEQRLTALEARR